jgi:hypothetical protein
MVSVDLNIEKLIMTKENKNNYHTFAKDCDNKSNDTTDYNEDRPKQDSIKSDNSKGKISRVAPLKFVKFLNTASSFWSKKFCSTKNN